MAAPVIRASGLWRIYATGAGLTCALRGVDLEVARGEFLAIMGPSGSGKSTLMSILGCLDRPTSGTYELSGIDVSTLSDSELAQVRSEALGFVFQSFNLLPRATVIRNAERLRLKESDRIAAMEAELRAVGGLVESEGGTITVQGCADRLHAPAGVLHGHNDHRVVMSLAVLSLATGIPLTVDDAEAITKSWPNFFEAIKPLGAEVEHVG